ncbi:MAG: MBL fold metallo-hydrolase [Thermoplasmata archaeon]
MAEILPGIHQVEGVDPSPDFSTHVYLVRDKGSTWTLIDTGLPGSDHAIVSYLAKHQIDPHSIRQILITHLHLDHTGNLKAMVSATGAKSFAHWIEAAYIERAPPYDGPGSPPKEAVHVDERIKDGDHLDAGGGLVAHHTPGHTPGHTSYWSPERKVLFTGDLLFGGDGKVELTPPEYTHHTQTAQISARRVASLRPESLLTYHGGPVLKNGTHALDSLVQGF